MNIYVKETWCTSVTHFCNKKGFIFLLTRINDNSEAACWTNIKALTKCECLLLRSVFQFCIMKKANVFNKQHSIFLNYQLYVSRASKHLFSLHEKFWPVRNFIVPQIFLVFTKINISASNKQILPRISYRKISLSSPRKILIYITAPHKLRKTE